MSDSPLDEILARALALDPALRAAYLDEACAGDPDLRADVESLLGVADRFPPPADPPAADPRDDTPLPERIGRYPVVGVVGAGGMGRVYRVRDPDLERDVALKRLPPGIQADPRELARFRREARVLARLRHPDIATVHSLESDAEGPFLTMELAPGRTLHAILADGPLPPERALRIGARIAGAVEAAHAEGIVHRDLKPLNIQIGEADEVKVLDFGLAKAVEEPAADLAPAADGPGPAGATLSGPVAGTPGYIAPEQLLGRSAVPATDLWALGCILFECLAGISPLTGADTADRLPTRLRTTLGALDPAPDWTRLPARLPGGVTDLLKSCLRADPVDRPTATDARRALEHGLEALAAPTVAARLLSRRGAVAVFVLLLAIAGAVTLGRTWRSPSPGIPTSTVRQLTFRGNSMGSDLSPDGRTVAYLDESGRLTYLDLESGRERSAPLTIVDTGDTIAVVGTRALDLRWSPTGRELALVAARKAADRAATTFIVPRDEHRAVALTDEDFAGVVWSPDGARLVGVSGLADRARLRIVDRGSGRGRDVSLAGPVRPHLVYDWVPGERIYFKTVESDTVFLVPATGGLPDPVMTASWTRYLPDLDAICWYADRRLQYAPLGPDGGPAGTPAILVDRLPAFASLFSLDRTGRRLLYENAPLIEVWLGERASTTDGDFRWSRLVRESMSTYAARFSPDGSRVAFVGTPPGTKTSLLQVLDLVDGTRTVAARDSAVNYLDWSPDGAELAYRCYSGLARVRLDDGVLRRVPGPLDPMYIRWPSDDHVLYMEGDGDLWQSYCRIDLADGRITRLPIDTERGTLFQFAVSPDGTRLAAAGNRGERDAVKVWLIDLADGSERLLHDGWAAPFEWSADGRWVYLATEDEPDPSGRRTSRLLRVAVDDGVVEPVADLPEPLFSWDHIDLSPDGRRLVCDQRRTGRDLWLTDIEPIRD